MTVQILWRFRCKVGIAILWLVSCVQGSQHQAVLAEHQRRPENTASELSPAIEAALGRSDLAAVPDLVWHAYVLLEGAPYPLKNRDDLLEYLEGEYKQAQDRAIALPGEVLIRGFREKDFPLQDSTAAIVRLHSRLSVAIPHPDSPRRGQRERPSLEELRRGICEYLLDSVSGEFSDHMCDQVAERRLRGFSAGCTFGTVMRITRYADACRDRAPNYTGFCGDSANRTYAQTFIDELMPPPVWPPEMTSLDAIQIEEERIESADATAGQLAQLVYWICRSDIRLDVAGVFPP